MRAAVVAASVLAACAPVWAAPAEGSEFGAGSTLLRALAGLAVVVGLVFLTRFLLVRLSPAGAGGTVRVREAVRLSPQAGLYVVEVEGRRLLLGQHLSVLCELGPPSAETASAFGERLRAAAERLRQIGAGPESPPARRGRGGLGEERR